MALAILTFLTVVFIFSRKWFFRLPVGEYIPQSRREHLALAAELLQERGYRIIGERLAYEIATYLDSRKYSSYLVVDFIVEKDGITYPVKVRTPRDPERVSGPWLRKQFYPLWTIFETPIAYVNPDSGSVELIDFALEYPSRYYHRRWRMRGIWLVIGVAAGWLLSLAH